MNSSTGTTPSNLKSKASSHPQDWGSALLAYGIWGLFPLFWRLFSGIPAFEIVLQRTLWSAVFLATVLTIFQRTNLRTTLSDGWERRRVLIPSALLIGTNWLVYVWAVGNGRVLEASLGYFICPFIQILLGTLFHGERMNRWIGIAIGTSLSGVAWIAYVSGLAQFPWVAIVLSTTFALYGSIKKSANIAPIQGAFFESTLLAGPALLVLLAHGTRETGLPAFYSDTRFWILSVIGGALTALPLILYSSAAKRLPLASLGFLQFLNPTIQFALAITVFGEVLQTEKIGGFALIWVGVGIYLAAKVVGHREQRFSPQRQSGGAAPLSTSAASSP